MPKRRQATNNNRGTRSKKPSISTLQQRRPSWAQLEMRQQRQEQQQQARNSQNQQSQNHQNDDELMEGGCTTATTSNDNNNHSSSQQKTARLLISLNNACNKHRVDHEQGGIILEKSSSSESNNDNDSNIPDACKKTYLSLQQILPKVEKAFKPPSDSNQNINNGEGKVEEGGKQEKEQEEVEVEVDAHDVATLCDFYSSVLGGYYCPHLLQLFGFGKDPKKVFDKVYYLLRHTISPSVVETAASASSSLVNKKKNIDDKEAPPQKEVVGVICHTIGSFLTLVENRSLYPIILTDLIDLLTDCSEILSETSSMLPIRMSILRNCRENIQQQQQNSGLCSLDLQSIEEVWLLQSVILTIVEIFLSDIRSERLINAERLQLEEQATAIPLPALDSNKNNYETTTLSEDNTSSNEDTKKPTTFIVGSCTIDLMFHNDLIRYDTMGLVLEALQQILLSDEYHNHYGRNNNNDNNPSPSSSLPIWQRRQMSALNMLLKIVQDWHLSSTNVPAVELFQASSIIVQSVLTYSRSTPGSNLRKFNEYENLLARLLQNSILDPPINHQTGGGRVGRSPLHIHDDDDVSAAGNIIVRVLPSLLDCMVHIARWHPNDRSALDTTVIRILDAILKRAPPAQRAFAVQYCTYHGFYESIMNLTRDPIRSNFAVGIFGSLSSYEERSWLEELEQLCSNEVERNTEECNKKAVTISALPSDSNDDIDTETKQDTPSLAKNNNVTTTTTTTTNSGTKRKRKNISPGKDLFEPLQLSPQRNRRCSNSGQSGDGVQGSNNNKSNHACRDGFTWIETLRKTLRDGITSGSALVELFQRKERNNDNTELFENPQTTTLAVLNNLGPLMGAVKCVCYALFLHYESNQDHEYKPFGCLKLLNLSFNHLRICCDHLFTTSCNDKEIGSLSDSERIVAQISSNCCLFLHYSTSKIFSKLKGCKEFFELGNNLFRIASTGLNLAKKGLINKSVPSAFSVSSECCRPRRMYCLQSVVGIPCREIRKGYRNNCQTPLCICGYFEQFDNENYAIRSKRYQGQVLKSSFTSTITALESLPLRNENCLLWLLALGPWSSPLAESIVSRPMHKERVDSVVAVIEECTEAYSVGDDLVPICLLNMVPSLLVSLANAKNENTAAAVPKQVPKAAAVADGRGKAARELVDLWYSRERFQSASNAQDSNSPSETFCDLSSHFIQKILKPILSSLNQNSDEWSECLLLVVKRLQSFRGLVIRQERGLWELDAVSTVDFMFGRDVFKENSSECSTHPDIDGTVNQLLSEIMKKVQLRDVSSFARKLVWACVANLVLSTPANEIDHKLAPMCNNPTLIDVTTSDCVSGNQLSWLLEAAFTDSDVCIRDYTSRRIARVAMDGKYTFLLSISSSAGILKSSNRNSLLDDMNIFKKTMQVQGRCDGVAEDFFRKFDHHMAVRCGLSGSLLSLTMAKSAADGDYGSGEGTIQRNTAEMQRFAARILVSLCQLGDLDHPMGVSMYSGAYRRLARLWAANPERIETSSIPEPPSTEASRALTFGELTCFSHVNPRQPSTTSVLSDRITATIFCDIWLLKSDREKEIRYLLLANFIQSFLLERPEVLSKKYLLKETSNYFESKLANFIGHLIVEKAKEPIFLAAGFRESLLEMQKKVKRASGFESLVVGGSNGIGNLCPSVRDLEKKAKTMCHEPALIEQFFPQVLIHNDKEPLVFFKKEILKESMKISQIMTASSSKMPILKGLAWELGGDEASALQAQQAIKFAAISILQESQPTNDDDGASLAAGVSFANLGGANARVAATDVVTSNFLYLCVNVVQVKWNMRSISERVQALRSLFGLMDFLLPSAAAQYFPHILAIVNSAILVADPSTQEEEGKDLTSLHLRLQAAKCLSKFVELVAGHHVEPVAQNLMTVVVTLIPLLEEASLDCEVTEYQEVIHDTRNIAVLLLEFLTSGELGKFLAPYFREIPFLPPSPFLGNVHKALRDNGVDYDNLMALSNASQEFKMEGVSATYASDTNDSRGSSASRSGAKVDALQKRINSICTLLGNENTSVRNVTLHHLIDLLRSNRSLFCSLVENESTTTTRMFLTTMVPDQLSSRGTVTEMIETLLLRCVEERDPTTRNLLATCLGEVGAIGEHHLGDLNIGGAKRDDSLDAARWRLEQPPWQSRPTKYELELVTQHLVAGLKAAPSSSDQNRIAFTIQQVLQQLNETTKPCEMGQGQPGSDSAKSAEMCEWLLGTLKEANVLEIIEPYWHSKFQVKEEGFVEKPPPFISHHGTYFIWISKFCRWMIHSSHGTTSNPKIPWKVFFYNCRQAIQAEAGLKVAEFVLPLLILDRLCSDSKDDELIRQEFLDVLNVDLKHDSMNETDRQKAVSAVFSVMDTLQYWSEIGKESIRKSSRGAKSRHTKRKSGHPTPEPSMSWPAEKAVARIDEVLSKIPLHQQARAASSVGMHARALQLLEYAGRKTTVQQMFESTFDPTRHTPKHADNPNCDIELRKDLLSKLDDCESMAALGGDETFIAPFLQVRDSFRRKEAICDYEGALKDYERGLQLIDSDERDLDLEKGALRCQLELGHFESVLKQTEGLKVIGGEIYAANTKRFAVEAAWRLGRWRTLSELVDDRNKDGESHDDYSLLGCDKYQECIGKIFLGLRKHDARAVAGGIQEARKASMDSLSVFARENYGRSYADIVRLHCLRELEDAAEILLQEKADAGAKLDKAARSKSDEGWEWDSRLNVATSKGASSIISTRVALARIGAEHELQSSLFLSIGKQARKRRLYGIAENYLSQAESVLLSPSSKESPSTCKLCHLLYSTRVQVAKLKHECGESTLALKILGQESVQDVCDKMLPNIQNETKIRGMAVQYETNMMKNSGFDLQASSDEKLSDRFVSRLLKSTQWMIEGGLTGGSEVVSRFRVIHKLAPMWEKGHFRFAKFVDSMMQARVTTLSSQGSAHEKRYSKDEDERVRSYVVTKDLHCQTYIFESMEHYIAALKISTKHVYQALPRLLSLWFEFTSIKWKQKDAEFNELLSRENVMESLLHQQAEANRLVAREFINIPSIAFYTAMPQLVSRVTHDDKDTALVVQSILHRVLGKFPLQAMWPLAWLKGSKNERRSHVGEEIFKSAQKSLQKSNRKMQKVLSTADALFKYLRELAEYNCPPDKNQFMVRPWQSAVELSEFIPPVQAALSASMRLSGDGRKDFFPQNVPRMRSICKRISVMGSKARPKRVKAFIVPSGKKVIKNGPGSYASSQHGDIGEIHFLVKQEAKGDLRKDARVQDLNNFINRLMASHGSSASRNKRKLKLRTFQVTCLSEDTGILEWVPHTDSLRNLVGMAYNPQTTSYCPRRRGHRCVNFSDPSLRTEYDRAQDLYFKEGKLAMAGSKFGELCLKFPPVFYWWFVQNFHDPHAWYEARNSFALSAAAWSAVGHIVYVEWRLICRGWHAAQTSHFLTHFLPFSRGLGDRHSENILLDTTNGQCVHVDFDCIFDKGLDLPKPEVTPFRLTQNMIDVFGPTGSDGIFSSGLQTAMATLRDNRDTLLSVLEPFTKDPVIDWRRSKVHEKQQQEQQQAQLEYFQKSRAKRAIKVIDERLQGIYNVKNNPNRKKHSRRDLEHPDESITSMTPLSVEGQVHKMIAEATSNENLVQLYVGWMPWV